MPLPQLILNKLAASSKRLFLIDSLGAALTVFFLVAVLARFEAYFGMPGKVLYFLALLAGVYAVYSASCYYFVKGRWRPFLRVIAIANLFYCCLTLGFMFAFYQRLSLLGLVYFLLEILLVVCLASIELKAASVNN